MRVVSSVTIRAPLPAVWEKLADLAGHVEWMADAEHIAFLGESRRGRGVRMEVLTRIGPFHTRDLMSVTEWVEGARIGVAHVGLVQGTGRFTLTPIGDATELEWDEDLTFPSFLGGALAGLIVRPVLSRVWDRNLARFRHLVEPEPDLRRPRGGRRARGTRGG